MTAAPGEHNGSLTEVDGTQDWPLTPPRGEVIILVDYQLIGIS